jgi:nucleotide-binding universal stress UspA family protein
MAGRDRRGKEIDMMKNILASIDLSEITGDVIDKAASLARTYKSKLWLIHVVAPDSFVVPHGEDPLPVRERVAEKIHEEHRQLQEKARELRSNGVNVTSLLVQGATVQVILKEAAKVDADLIVLGSHRDSPLYRYLLGSVTEGVLEGITCPLLIVPSRESRFRAA